MSVNEAILVTGASGHLGQLILDALLKLECKHVIATTRTPAKLASYARRGVEVRPTDFTIALSLVDAFRGATRMLLISTSAVGARVAHHQRAIAAARKAGIRHIVYTSWPNPDKSLAAVASDHATTERDIKESGLKYTFLRNYTYAENLLYFVPAAVETGTLYGSAGDGKVAFVARQDCANAATIALIAADRYENAILDITGPVAHSFSDIARIVGEIKRKKIVYTDLSPEEYKSILMKDSFLAPHADIFVSIHRAYRQGELAKVSDAVWRLSGGEPQNLMEFLSIKLK